MTACGNCHSDVPKGSRTCPRCGGEMPKGFFASLLGGIFGTRSAPTGPNLPAPQAPPAETTASPRPESSTGAFAFEVEDIFTITGRGTVATGRISRGSISVGDEVAFLSPKGDRVKLRVSGIESFRKIVQVANEGDTVGLLLAKPVSPEVLVRGTILERA